MSNRQTKEETDRSLGIAPNSAAQDRDRVIINLNSIIKWHESRGQRLATVDVAILVNARDALLAHEQQQLGLPGQPQAEQRSQAAATFTDKSGGERCITCGRTAPAADPPRDDLVAKLRALQPGFDGCVTGH